MDKTQLEKYTYISFDIFDTLVKRNIFNPTDIFVIMELKYNENNINKISDFKNIRVSCEKECKNENNTEITLDMIYDKISNKLGNEVADKLKELEKNVELSFIQKNINADILDIYDWAIKNKKVVITSDMYLPRSVIDDILTKCGIKYHKLYLSSEIGKKKSTSDLFKYIISDLNISSSEMIHIGDNRHSDYDMAKKAGIDSILIPNRVNRLSHFNKNIYNEIKNNIDYNILQSFINNNVPQSKYFNTFGYECFGPMLFSFSQWLLSELKKQDIRKVYFMARDGKIMKKAFDIVNVDNKIKSYYFMASRRSIIVPSLWKYSNINSIFKSINIPKEITLNDLKKRLGLDDTNIDSLLSEFNLEKDKKYNFDDLQNNNKLFFEKLYPLIVDNSKREYSALEKYLTKMDFCGKVAIVDIGWYGNMQQSLTRITNTDIYGYYFGLRPNKNQQIKTYGFAFDKNLNEDYNDKEYSFNSIFEFIFSATHGSVKRFVSSDDYVELYESENINNYEMDSLVGLQSGAIEFVNTFNNFDIKDYIKLDVKTACFNMFEMLFNPSYADSYNFGNVKFQDGEVTYIAKSKGFKYYFIRPKNFLKDLKNSSWKIGFMKNTFKINLPYRKIYEMIKNSGR